MFKSSLNNSPENVLNTHETFRVPHKFSNVAKVFWQIDAGTISGTKLKDLRSGLVIKALGSQGFMIFFQTNRLHGSSRCLY